MNKQHLFRTAVILCCVMITTVFTACKQNNEPVKPGEAEYTVMYYANGGSNVDKAVLSIIEEFYDAEPESFKNVNVVVQYKFSTTENLKAHGFSDQDAERFGSKTYRWQAKADTTDILDQIAKMEPYGADNADCTCPDSLTNFINWAARTHPAKKYFFIINDHGGGYMPHDDKPEQTASATPRQGMHRGMIYDDGYYVGGIKKHFTVKTFTSAVRAANVRCETIFLLACLMNNLEYLFEMQDLSDYIIASTFVMPACLASTDVLVNQLSAHPNNPEQVLSAYCKADVEGWDEQIGAEEGETIWNDLTVTRTANLPAMGKLLRTFTDRLCDTYANGTPEQKSKIDYCTQHTMKIQIQRPYYDIAKYITSLFKALPEVYDNAFCEQFQNTFNSCIVDQHYSHYLEEHHFEVDYSVLIGMDNTYSLITWDSKDDPKVPVAANIYASDGEMAEFSLHPVEGDPESYTLELVGEKDPWGSTFDQTYKQLEFDKIVGWSRWIELNQQHPNLFCPSDMNFQLPN